LIIFLKINLFDVHAGKKINDKNNFKLVIYIIYLFYREVVESIFMSSMKEADMLKHRSQVFSTMQRHQHNELWSGILNGK